jgi:hypothetical protein
VPNPFYARSGLDKAKVSANVAPDHRRPAPSSLSERAMRAWRRVLGQMPAEHRDDVIAIEIAVVHAHLDGWQPCIDVFKNELNGGPVVLTVNEMQFPYATSGLDLDQRRPDDTTNLCERQTALRHHVSSNAFSVRLRPWSFGVRSAAFDPRFELRHRDLVRITLLPNDFDAEMRVAVDLDIYAAHPATAGWPGWFC